MSRIPTPELCHEAAHTTLFSEKDQSARVSMHLREEMTRAYLNFFKGFEYEPTADCDAMTE